MILLRILSISNKTVEVAVATDELRQVMGFLEDSKSVKAYNITMTGHLGTLPNDGFVTVYGTGYVKYQGRFFT